MNRPQKIKKPYLSIDPRSKMALCIVVALMALGIADKGAETLAFSVVLLLMINAKQFKIAMICAVLFLVMMLSDIYIAPGLSGPFAVFFLTIVRVFRMFMPIYMCVLLIIKTTTVNEFIAAFKRMHIPDKVIIPLSVMFRFIPTIREEWQSIRAAMKFRGISMSLKNLVTSPMVTLEYMLVPMLMSASNISGELAAASLSRGLDTDRTRTCIKQIKFGVADAVVLAAAFTMVLWLILEKDGMTL